MDFAVAGVVLVDVRDVVLLVFVAIAYPLLGLPPGIAGPSGWGFMAPSARKRKPPGDRHVRVKIVPRRLWPHSGSVLALLVTRFATMVGLASVVVMLGLVLYGIERRASRHVAQKVGWHAVLVTGWIGVPLHELSHLVVARLLGHRIVDYRLLAPDPATGTLGYVRHAYLRKSPWQPIKDACIALAPLAAGLAVLASLVAWTTSPTAIRDIYVELRATTALPAHPLPTGLLTLAGALLHGLDALTRSVWVARGPWLPLQLYFAIAVAAHMAPSARDLRTAGMGLVVLGSALCLCGALVSARTSIAALMLVTCLLVAATLLTLVFQIVCSAAAGLVTR